MSSNVEQIKEKLDIVEVIGSYIKVEKAGINYKARCPFHNEKSPSFFISPTRQTFYCFGCGEKGDIFSFVEKFEGVDFRSALKSLADRAGIEITNYKRDEKQEDYKDKLYEVMEKATIIYEENLKKDKKALKYLEKRGLTDKSIQSWRLGLAKDEWRSLHDDLIGAGYSKEIMLQTGLLKKVENEEKYYDTFRDRVVFPISDSSGRVVAFSGRTLKDSSTESGKTTPKYLNSPETPIFYKSDTLYGFNVAKNYIRKLDYAVLVEGQMDIVMSHQSGVFNTVASSGTALSELHLKRLQKLSNRVIVAYDSDVSGQNAAKRAGELALKLGMEIKIASLPSGEDPASLIIKNVEDWKKVLRESLFVIDFALEKTIKENKGRNLTKEINISVLPLVTLLKSEIERSQYIKKIANKLEIGEEAVRTDLKKIINIENKKDSIEYKEYEQIVNPERILSGIIFWSKKPEEIRDKWEEIIGVDEVQKILNLYESDKDMLVYEAENYSQEGDISRIYEDVLRRIELNELKQRLRTKTSEFDKETNTKKQEEIKEEVVKISNRINELSK